MEAAALFESYLGCSKSEDNSPFAFTTLLALDEKEQYPASQMGWLNEYRLYEHFIPRKLGGKLVNLYELIYLWRLLARRDVTCAIAYGGTLLGAITVWIAGSDELKEKVAKDIRNEKKIAFAMTEQGSGSDLLAIQLKADYNTILDQFELSGEKWLYNHATRSHYTTLLLKTNGDAGPRSCSLVYTHTLGQCCNMETVSLKKLQRIHTMGVRGLDLGGISFDKHIVPGSSLIGKTGFGFELAITGLQVTKMLCAGIALGSLDTLFRTTVRFCLKRILYKAPILNIPVVKAKIAQVFMDIIVAESLCMASTRMAQLKPEQYALLSSITKAFVPTLVETDTKELSSLLGARSYLSSETDYRIFQKQARDNAIIPIFEGNTYVNYQYAIQQLVVVFSLQQKIDCAATLEQLFDLKAPLPEFECSKLSVVGKGKNDLAFGLPYLLSVLEEQEDFKDKALILEELYSLIAELELIKNWFLSEKPNVNNTFVIHPRVFNYAYRYALLMAVTAAAGNIYWNREDLQPGFSWQVLLKVCLTKAGAALRGEFYEMPPADEDLIISYVTRCSEDSSLFSLFPFKVN